jgi:hypothetical protein
MSIVQVRQIGAYIEHTFMSHIYLSDCDNLPSDQRKDKFLSRGVAALALMKLANLTPEMASAAVVDGYDDNGIDAIYFDQSERLLYIIQSKWDRDGAGAVDLADANKFIAGVNDLVHPRFERFNARVRARAEEINKALTADRTRVIPVLAYTGSQQLSVHVNRVVGDLLAGLNDTGDVATFQSLSQKELYSAIADLGDSIDLEVMLYEWAKVSTPYEAYYGQVKAADVASWWHKHGFTLFTANLRNFLGAGDVSQGMSATLATEPENFWYFNNGVTVLCGDVTKKLMGGNDRTAGTFDCKKVSIVNGAQTVGTIGLTAPNFLENAMIPVRFISLAKCPEGFGVAVTRAANTQNRIEARDFAALDPEQERLRVELLIQEKKQYVYKSGSYTIAPQDGCTIDEATVALACASPEIGLAVQAKREISKLYEDITKAPYKLLFNGALDSVRMWRTVQLMRVVDEALKNQDDSAEPRARMVSVHGNRLILHEVFQSLSPDQWKQDISSLKPFVVQRTQSIRDALAFAVEQDYPNSYLNSLFKNLQKCHDLSESIRSAPTAPQQLTLIEVASDGAAEGETASD